jgi:hypothetical protein
MKEESTLDASRLGTGEKIAGISAVILFFDMFIFDWFGFGSVDTAIGEIDIGGGFNAWQSFDFIDIVLLLTVGVAIGVAVMAANASKGSLPVAGGALVAGMGILSTILIIYRIIDPPSGADREIGVFIGLIAAAGIAYGGWTAMEEEGTSFGQAADGMRGGGDDSPPPPPPPPTPPSAG